MLYLVKDPGSSVGLDLRLVKDHGKHCWMLQLRAVQRQLEPEHSYALAVSGLSRSFFGSLKTSLSVQCMRIGGMWVIVKIANFVPVINRPVVVAAGIKNLDEYAAAVEDVKRSQ